MQIVNFLRAGYAVVLSVLAVFLFIPMVSMLFPSEAAAVDFFGDISGVKTKIYTKLLMLGMGASTACFAAWFVLSKEWIKANLSAATALFFILVIGVGFGIFELA